MKAVLERRGALVSSFKSIVFGKKILLLRFKIMSKHQITLNLDTYQISLISDWIEMAADNLHDERSLWDEFETSNYLTYGTTDYWEAQAKLEDIISQLKKTLLPQRACRFQELSTHFHQMSINEADKMFQASEPDKISYHSNRMQRYGLAADRADYYAQKLSGKSPDFPHPWTLNTDALTERNTFLGYFGRKLDNPLILTYYSPAR
jgi:hypothetical protein